MQVESKTIETSQAQEASPAPISLVKLWREKIMCEWNSWFVGITDTSNIVQKRFKEVYGDGKRA